MRNKKKVGSMWWVVDLNNFGPTNVQLIASLSYIWILNATHKTRIIVIPIPIVCDFK